MLQFAVFTQPGGALYADYSGRVTQPRLSQNKYGFAESSGFVPMGLQEAFQLYDRAGVLHVLFSDQASDVVYEGRLEDVEITGDGVQLRAFGYSRAMGDVPYTALWSDTSVARWRPVLTSDIALAVPDRFTTDTNNRIYITAQKGATFGTTGAVKAGYMMYQIPDQSSRLITGLSFDYTANAPINWRAGCNGYAVDFSSVPAALTPIITPGGGPVAGSLNVTFTGQTIIVFYLFFNAADAVLASETGAVFISFTNVRVVTSTTNRVNTTFAANRAAGTNVTAMVGSTANIYVGQVLTIGPSPTAESVTVLSIGGPTTFNATFLNPYVIGNTVQAHVIYADEIVRDLVGGISTLNPTQLSSATGLVQSPLRDLTDQVFVDDDRATILDLLTTLGDIQNPPRQWEWGVQSGRRLYFRPQGDSARTWYVDVSDIDIQRSIDAMYNYVYATYQESNGRRVVGSSQLFDSTSIARYGILRLRALSTNTTSAIQADDQARAILADSKDPKPRAGLTIADVRDAAGLYWPLTQVRVGDTVIIRNLPPTLSTVIDRIRTFRITRVEMDLEANKLTVEPESPLPTLAALLALAVPATRVNNNAQAFLHGRSADGTYDPNAQNW